MNTMEITIKQDSYIRKIIKWTCLSVLLMLFAIAINTLHQDRLQKLATNAALLGQKSFLVSQMHKEMLSISRTQLQILHASNQQQIKENLWHLSELVSDHLVHYHQLKNIADESDADLLMQFKIGFEQWHYFNKDLLVYANVVSDSGFINTLNKVDLAFSQFDSNSDKKQLLITQLKQDSNNDKSLSN
jgi:hypothetical protein